jgi:hypothetical protein
VFAQLEVKEVYAAWMKVVVDFCLCYFGVAGDVLAS